MGVKISERESEELTRSGVTWKLVDYSDPDNRPRCFYYRPSGMEVGPWPCDPKSQKYYLSKGFLLEPPKERKPQQIKKRLVCPVCGNKYNKLSRLIACLKKHKKEEVDVVS